MLKFVAGREFNDYGVVLPPRMLEIDRIPALGRYKIGLLPITEDRRLKDDTSCRALSVSGQFYVESITKRLFSVIKILELQVCDLGPRKALFK